MADTAKKAVDKVVIAVKKLLQAAADQDYNVDKTDVDGVESLKKFCTEQKSALESKRRQVLISLADYEAVINRLPDGSIRDDAETSLSELQGEVEALVSDINESVANLEDNEESYKRALEEEPAEEHAEEDGDEAPTAVVDTIKSEARGSRTHLPRQELPKFNGQGSDWRQFLQIFESSMKTERLTDLEKLRYLIGCLEGKAREVVSGYAITNGAYGSVLQALKDEYGDDVLVKARLHSQLRSLEKAGDSILSAHRTVMKIQMILRQMQQLGEDTNHAMMENTLMEKLPSWLNKEILKFKRSIKNKTDVDKMIEFAITEVKDRRTVDEVAGGGLRVRVNFVKENTQSYGKRPATRSYETRQPRQESWGGCFLCGESGHFAGGCKRYPTLNDKKAAIAEKRLCYKCLHSDHPTRDCKRKPCRRCKVGQHHESICDKKPAWQSVRVNTLQRGEQPTDHRSVILPTCNALIINLDNGRKKKVAFLLDSGSEASFIKEATARALGLERLRTTKVALTTFNGQKTTINSSEYVLGLKERNGNVKRIRIHSAPEVTHRLPIVNGESEKTEYVEPEILLGSDVFWEIVEGIRGTLPSGLTLVDTTLGRVTTGKTNTAHMDGEELIHLIIQDEKTLDNLSKEMFKLESVGIMDDPEEDADVEARRIFYEKIKRLEDGRYSVSYLWREAAPVIPDNRYCCFKRLQNLVKRLREGGQMEKYDKAVRELVEQGVIEEVDEQAKPSGPVWYAPHHAVTHKAKPNKPPRMVHDASCGGRGRSLNSHLYAGENLIPKIFNILLKMRTKKIIVTCDIAKAFNQLALNEEDRDAMRFLWIKDVTQSVNEANLLALRFRRVPFGVISAPYLLQETIHHHLRSEDTPLAREIEENIYADNIVMSAETTEEARKKCVIAKEIFAKAHMPLREYFSNDLIINREFADDPEAIPETKFLGVKWNLVDDQLCIRSGAAGLEPPTKKTVLTTIASVYDPLGIASPALLPARIFYQKILEKEWDEVLDAENQQEWMELAKDLHEKTFQMPRRIVMEDRFEIHVFTDASKVGYGLAIYVRSETDGAVSCRLLTAKSKVAPAKKKITIPQMELMGVEIGSAVAKYVKENLAPKAKVTLWTDNKPIIEWIRDEKEKSHGKFVQNRVLAIKRNASVDVFRYVPTLDNPADMCSRGVKMEELDQCKLWKEGPPWLSKGEEQWPKSAEGEVIKAEDATEVEEPVDVAVNAVIHPGRIETTEIDRFSNWNRMLNSYSYVLRFIRNLAKKSAVVLLVLDENVEDEEGADGPSAQERKRALKAILRTSASEYPPSIKEINEYSLTEGLDGIWRCDQRMMKSDLPETAKKPVFISRRSPVARLLVKDAHVRMFHGGTSSTVSAFRANYCVPQPRQLARTVIAHCSACRRRKLARPFLYPTMGDLPKERTRRYRPFENVGIDLLGPLGIKGAAKEEKAWIALFSCMATRAIHLELVEDISAATFLLAMRKFVARRGRPKKILTDNAGNFQLASQSVEIWKSISENSELRGYLARESIEWSFITPRAPWRGAFYERMMAHVKEAIRGAIGRRSIPRKEMETLVAEVEAVVNCRPITVDDAGVALRPIDFLMPLAEPGVPHLDDDDEEEVYGETSRDRLIKMWRTTTRTLDEFWRKWTSLYLTELRDRQKKQFPQGRSVTKRVPVKEEVVLVVDERLPRGEWRLATIEEVIPGNDGAIRTARIRMENGRITTRGINHLIPLEQAIIDGEPAKEKESSPMSLIETDCVYGNEEAANREQKEDSPMSLIETDCIYGGADEKPKQTPEEKTRRSRKRKEAPIETSLGEPRYNLRPRKMTTILAISLMMIFGTVEAENCPNNQAPQDSKIEFIESCSPSGLIVYRTRDDGMCYTMKSCIPKMMVLMEPRSVGEDPCGPVCRCPGWADGCSFFRGPYTANSTEEHRRTRKLLDDSGLRACSWGRPKKGCAKEPIETDVHQIELYDGTRHHISNLQLRMFKVTHPWCIGGPRRSGTPDYCKQNRCEQNPNGFCTTPRTEMTFLETQFGTVAIKAWGHVRVRYFGFSKVSEEEGRVREDKNSMEQSAFEHRRPENSRNRPAKERRRPGKPRSPPRKNRRKPEKVKERPMEEPGEAKVQPRRSFGKLAETRRNKDTAMEDQAGLGSISKYVPQKKGECKSMDLLNLDCWTWWMAVIAAIACYLALFILAIMAKLLCIITDTITCLKSMCCYTARTLSSTARWTKRKAKTAARRFPAKAIIVIFAMLGRMEACDRTLAITARAHECAIEENGERVCKISQVLDIDGIRSGSTVCVFFSTPEGDVSSKMTKMRVMDALVKCKTEKLLFHTRAYRTTVASMRRCPESGSCKELKCSNIGAQERIPELGVAANFPGTTRCRESSSCWANGCLLCTPACLFYRIYATPAEDEWTSISECEQGEAEVAMELGSEKPNSLILLRKTERVQVEGLTIVLKSISDQPEVKGTKILRTAGEEPAVATDDEAREMRNLQCSNRNFTECHLKEDTCTCEAFKDLVSCTCQPSILLEVRREKKIPRCEFGVCWNKTGKKITAKRSDSTISIRLIAKESMVATYHREGCSLKLEEITGCAGCEEGAEMSYVCTSKHPQLLVLHCNLGLTTTLQCGTDTQEKARIFYDVEQVRDDCNYVCGGQRQTITLTGSLRAPSPDEQRYEENADKAIPVIVNELSLPSLPSFDMIGYMMVLFIISVILVAGVCRVAI